MSNRIIFYALRQNTVGHTAAGLWKHPDSEAHKYRSLDYWIETAQLAERGCFDALFIADALGPLDTWQGTPDAPLRDGIQTPTDDPLVLVPALAAATKNLGIAVTVSTTYELPYQFARTMTTLDHLTNGRVGWNIVTSSLESAARNLGLDTQIPHDERYAIADEFMDVVYKLWEGSWQDDAVVFDQAGGVFADPTKVHPIGHKGRYFSVPGIALSEPSIQRTPALYQAGTSTAGRAFAGKHAEGIFLSTYEPHGARKLIDAIKQSATDHGRDSSTLKFLTIATAVVAETDDEAQALLAEYQSYSSITGSLARWSALMQIDLSQLDLDQPLKHVETEGIRSMVDLFTQLDPSRTWTPREIAEFVGFGGGGPVFVGSPTTVADQLEEWIDISGADGFNLVDPIPTKGLRDFVTLVVPELQQRGRMWTRYEGSTLREYLQGLGQTRVRRDHPATQHSYLQSR